MRKTLLTLFAATATIGAVSAAYAQGQGGCLSGAAHDVTASAETADTTPLRLPTASDAKG